jgi:NAD(P)-dependent dehydrogenase (short-subunit alcohol dehydrogenase family)
MNVVSSFDLSGRTVWVTGAGKGLGRAIATAMVHAGARVAVTARTADDLERLADELTTVGKIDVVPASVDDAGAVDAALRTILERSGRVDGVVNAAGISPVFVRSERLGDDDWQRVLRVNLDGTFHVCRAAGRVMLEQGSGSIVNVTSVHADVGAERIAAYAASKGAVAALSKTLAVEWASRGVRVNCLAPGYVPTDLSIGLLDSPRGEQIRARIPMGRTGYPVEVAGAAVFLVSDASAYTTGSTITTDGGWTAW